ncbi:MAG: four helix bundle protein [Patescibacteria group bacterium]
MDKITSFTDLVVWQKAHHLAVEVYKITKIFPKEETYSLVDQMKRCSVSISSNIAEGFIRRGKKEKLQFYFTAKGSLIELQNQLLLSKDVGYISKLEFSVLAEKTVEVHKLLNGFIRSAESRV